MGRVKELRTWQSRCHAGCGVYGWCHLEKAAAPALSHPWPGVRLRSGLLAPLQSAPLDRGMNVGVAFSHYIPMWTPQAGGQP